MRTTALVLAALVFAGAAGIARAATSPGAWTTFIRAGEFTGLFADTTQVWGATAEGGLVHWDRATQGLTILRREPGTIASNHLTAVVMDRSGRLWVGTEGSGVSRRSADGHRWEVMNLLDGLPSDSVRVLEAIGDTLWIGTTRGFSLWNGRQVSGSLPDGGITVSFDTTFANPSVTGIAMAGDSLWISTRRGIGLARISHQLSDWRPVNQGLTDIDIRSLAFDGVDLFAHAGTSVYHWDEGSSSWALSSVPVPVHRLTDAWGAVLAASESGLFRWFGAGWIPVSGAPTPQPVQSEDPEVTMDSGGRFYAALGETLFVELENAGPWIPYPLPDGAPGNDVRQVAVDRGSVYATTGVQGVGRYNGQWRYWPPVSCSGAGCDTTFYRPRFVNGFFVDRAGRKWAASWSIAVDTFLDDGPVPSFNHPVIREDLLTQRRTWWGTATQDHRGTVWLGMDTEAKGDIEALGLELYDSTGTYLRNFNSTNSAMSGNLVHGLATTRNGRVWVGYENGGVDFVAPPADSVFIHLNTTTSEVVRGMTSFGDSLWLVTNNEVMRFPGTATSTTKALETIELPSGPPQLGFKPMDAGRDGTVWVGTSAGVHHVGNGALIETFDVANSPLPDNEVRSIAADRVSGVIWIATAGGLARFDPGYVPPPAPKLPALHIRVFPNPSLLTNLGVQLRIQGDAESYTGQVYDITGRKVRRLRGALNGGFVWDGRDDDGGLVSPGIYFLRVEAQGRSAVARVVLLH